MDKKYDIIVIDPPWMKKKGGLRQTRPNQERKLDYETMTTNDIFTLLDSEILIHAADIHNIFLWVIDSYLIESETKMLERGYKRHARIIWDKENGVAPAFTLRYTHEYLIWYYKPKLMPVAESSRGKLTTVVREKSREHSRKPDISYTNIELWYPDKNYLDVFSREKRKGWDQWGDQCSWFA